MWSPSRLKNASLDASLKRVVEIPADPDDHAGQTRGGKQDQVSEDTEIREALRDVIDPELGVNIVDLGLVYSVEVDAKGVRVAMTMTSPACPMGSYLCEQAEAAVRRWLPEVAAVEVVLVEEPPWTAAMMSEEARNLLGWGD